MAVLEKTSLADGAVADAGAVASDPVAAPHLQACLNGARDPSEHPRLTTDPAVLAAEAAACVAAGASSVHVHPKDEHGRDTLAAVHVDRFVQALRVRCPGLPVGVTTGAWAEPDPAARVSAIAAWSVLPDVASVNWHEPGAEEVARALSRRGIGVEAGIWNAGALQAWAHSALRDSCVRVLVELPSTPDATDLRGLAEPLVHEIQTVTDRPILLHGEDSSAWHAIDLALAAGLQTRVGLEDTLLLRSGRPAPDNASLVRDVPPRRA